jgi:hypothetical protein
MMEDSARARRRLPRLVGAAVGVGLLAGVVVWVRTADVRPELRAVAADVEQIDGPFEWAGTRETGTLFCVISCDEYRLVVTFTTALTPGEACDEMHVQLTGLDLGEFERVPYLTGCGGDLLPLTQVSRSSNLTFGTSAHQRVLPFAVERTDAGAGPTTAWVVVSSGVD